MLNNIVDNLEQCGQQNIVHCCFHQARTGCSFFAVYVQSNNSPRFTFSLLSNDKTASTSSWRSSPDDSGFVSGLLTRTSDSVLDDLNSGDESGFSLNASVNKHNIREYCPRGEHPLDFEYVRNDDSA